LDKITDAWRKIHSKEHNFDSFRDFFNVTVSSSIQCARYVTRMGKVGNAHKILVGRREGRKYVDMKMDLK